MAGALALVGLAAGAGPAAAATTGELEQAYADKGVLNVLFSASDEQLQTRRHRPGLGHGASVDGRADGRSRAKPDVWPSPQGKADPVAVLVLDTSGSMKPERLDAAKNAAIAYLDDGARRRRGRACHLR